MTIIKEYRIHLPITVEEYKVGQLYSIAEASKDQTGGGEGVEILKNEPYSDETGSGQYTHKIYRMDSKIPGWVKMIFGAQNVKNMAQFDERAWNAYPHCKTVLTNPLYMKECFETKIETWHKADWDLENVHGLPPDVWQNVQVVPIDIAADVAPADYKPEFDPCIFKSAERPDRAPLNKNWMEQTKKEIVSRRECEKLGIPEDQLPSVTKHMCIYKLVTIKCRWRPITSKLEGFGHNQQKRIYALFHRQVFTWLDSWINLTMEDIRKMEDKTKADLDKYAIEKEVRGEKLTA